MKTNESINYGVMKYLKQKRDDSINGKEIIIIIIK